MMMTSISQPNSGSGAASQTRLNMERLRAVRERIMQEQGLSTPASATPNAPVQKGFTEQLSQTAPVSVRPPAPKQQVMRENEQASHLEDMRINVLNDAQATQVMTHNTALHPHVPLTAKRDLQPQGRFGLPLNDIQQVASESGFVGLSADAIERAYASRKSLFIDVTI